RKRAVIAQHHLGERIAHQDHVNAGFINQTRCGIVVGSQAGDKFMPLLFLLDGECSYFQSGARELPSVERSDAHYASSAVRELPIPPVTAFDAAEVILLPENAFWREKT